MKTHSPFLTSALLASLVFTPLPTRAGVLAWIASFGEKIQKLVDKSRANYREAMEQSGIREDEMRANPPKEPVVSDADHRRNVDNLKSQYEDSLNSLLVTAAKLEEKRRRASGAERQKIDKEIDRVNRQIPSIEQEIKNHGGDPMDTHLDAGREIDALRRESRNNTPVTDDGAALFLPGFGSAWSASSRSREDAQRTARNAGRSSGAPEQVATPKPKPTSTKTPRRIRPRPAHTHSHSH